MKKFARKRLCEIATIERNVVMPKAISSGTMYIGLEHIATGGEIVGAKPVENAELASAKFHFDRNHILYGKLRPYLAKIALPNFSGVCSTDILPIRPNEQVDRRFICYFLRQPELVKLAASQTSGANLPRLSPSTLEAFEIPLPPLPEQRRIADILDRADALRAQRRAALAQLDALPQAIFLEMFGDLDTNPNGFPVSSVGELALVQGGLQLSSSRKNIGASIPYLRVANVYRNRLDLSEIKHMKASPNEVARTRLMSGDILVVEGHGNPNEIGRAAMWRGEIETCVHQNHLIRIRVDQASLQPQFLCHLLNSRGGRKHLLRSGKTTSGLNTITVSEVRLAPIFVPPNFLQTEFDVRVKAIERLQSSYSSFLANSDSLFASLQHRAFRGEL